MNRLHPRCTGVSRRTFLADVGMGFTGLALGSMLAREQAVARAAESAVALAPKAKSVIWLFMVGGTSHMESFDPKPELNKHAGKTIAESPYGATLDSPLLKKNLREFIEGNHQIQPTLYPMQIDHRPRGESGIEISDWWPHLGNVVDELAIVRSMWTTDNDHGAQLQFHTGRHALEGHFPTIGSWVHYALGSLSDDLPQFVVLGTPLADCCGGRGGHGSNYLGPEHTGVQLEVNPEQPLPYGLPAEGYTLDQQRRELELLRELHGIAEVEYPTDDALRARIKSYELAARMQLAVPDVVRFSDETAATHTLYGMDQDTTRTFGGQCLAARRLVERGVRFVQIFHGSNGGAGAWDAHGALKTGHTKLCAEVDQPIAALITDLKQRGLLDETLVVWGTEFGRTPGCQGSDGRDHHPYGFSIWLAGGGIKRGVVHGATDEIGFHAVEHRHYVTDLHATVLRQLGIDHRSLEIPGRKRLEIDFGHPIEEIIA